MAGRGAGRSICCRSAESLTLAGFGETVTYSRKVFIPLTQLCRDVCHYCTFAKAPRRLESAYLTAERSAGDSARRQGCGLQGSAVYARRQAGSAVCGGTQRPRCRGRGQHAGLPGAHGDARAEGNRTAASSQSRSHGRRRSAPASPRERIDGIDARERFGRGCASGVVRTSVLPTRLPARRLATLRAAGELGIPDDHRPADRHRRNAPRAHRVAAGAARAPRQSTVICRNSSSRTSRPSPEPRWPLLPSLPWKSSSGRWRRRACCLARACRFRRRPTCAPKDSHSLVRAGINDWGGVSPVTPDHVNPEAPWPHLADLARDTDAAGRDLVERLAIVPAYAARPEIWTDPAHHAARAPLQRQPRFCAAGRLVRRARAASCRRLRRTGHRPPVARG